MKNYEKPDILRVENLSEGVYLASGEPICGSVYMKGKFYKPGRGIEPDSRLARWGCEGCPADDGDKCAIANGTAGNEQKDFRPTWERDGKDPTNDIIW